MKINKATYVDKRRYLSRALKDGYLEDWDDEYILFEKYDYQEDKYNLYRAKYTFDDISAVIDYNTMELAETETMIVGKGQAIDEEGMTSIIEKTLKKLLPNKEKENRISHIQKFNQEEMIAVEPLYIAFGETDEHADAYNSGEDVYQLVDALNKANGEGILSPSLFHITKTSSFEVGNAWVNEEEVQVGDEVIPALQPLVEIHFKNEKAWELRKSRKLMGLSIGALAFESKLSPEEEAEGIIKRKLTNFDFSFDGGHLAYTDISTEGAASGKNDPYLLKTKKPYILKMKKPSHLSLEQKEILEELGEEFIPLDKSKNSSPSPKMGKDSPGEGANINKSGNTKGMTEKEEKLMEEVKVLKKALISKSLKSFDFEEKLLEQVSDVMSSLQEEGKEVIIKALNSFKEKNDKVKEDLENKQVEVEKSVEKFAESLSDEIGSEEVAGESPKKLTLKQKVAAARKEQEGGK